MLYYSQNNEYKNMNTIKLLFVFATPSAKKYYSIRNENK